MKKTISVFILLLLFKNIHAQKSIGIRTGINIHQIKNLNVLTINQVSWSQQTFFQRPIKEKLLLELSLNHYTTTLNLKHIKVTPDRVFTRYNIKSNYIDFNALISYRLYHYNKLSLYGGLGTGITFSRRSLDYSVDKNNQNEEMTYSIFDIHAPNGLLAVTANYKLSNKLTISTQLNTMLYIPNKEFSTNANLGIGYTF